MRLRSDGFAASCRLSWGELRRTRSTSRVAERAADGHTIQMAETILAQERAAAGKLELALGRAVDASLEAQGVAA